MLKLKRTSIIGLVLIGLLGLSSVAMAEHDDDHPEDTMFSFGYDEVNHFLVINIGPNDTLYECIFENGTLSAIYGDESGGSIPVDELNDSGEPKSFDPRTEGLADELTPVSDSVEYTGADGECGVRGVVVAGPNGQINHGQFMKAAKGLLDFKGHGCVVHHLAKSDIGKTETTKLATSDVDPDWLFGESGDIDFSTFETDCSHGKSSKEAKADKGRPDKPGKSAKAPGKNK